MTTRRTFTTHTLDDEALASMSATEAIAFASSRKPEDLGKLDGEPVVFTYRRLTREQRLFCESATTEAEKYERAFMGGVVQISGGFFGAEWTPAEVNAKTFVAMSMDEVAHLEDEIGPAAILDVGMVVYVRSWLRPKAEPLFPRPPTSLLAWDALRRPSVEPSREDARPNSGERSAARA